MLCNSLEYFILNKFSLETIVICNDKFVILCKDVIIQKVKSYRQSGYEEMKNAANEIAENIECSAEYPSETEVRARDSSPHICEPVKKFQHILGLSISRHN